MLTRIIVRLTIEGVHRWENCNISDVDYLKNLHRHVFYIECKKSVKGLDRDIEFICLKTDIMNYLNLQFCDFNYRCCNFHGMSCEQIATLLLEKFQLDSCAVLEDNENGAEVINNN